MKSDKIPGVIFLIPEMSGGGAERVISILANFFAEHGISTKILMTAGNTCVYQLNPLIELFQASGRSNGSMLARMRRIVSMRQFFVKNRESVLVSFEPDAGFYAGFAKFGLHMRMISSERNDPASFGSSLSRKVAYFCSDWIVFQTKDAQNFFSAKIKMKSSVIMNPIDANFVLPYRGVRKKTIVNVGRLEEQKNQAMLIEAFEIFSRNHPDYSLHIYGKGSLEANLKIFVKEKGIAEKVFFEGYSKNIISEIIDAGMFALSSNYEGISNSLLEAMAVELPVISTDCPCGGSSMCINDKISGLLVPVGDSGAMAEAMAQIADNNEFAEKLANNAGNIRIKCSLESVADEWMSLISGKAWS